MRRDGGFMTLEELVVAVHCHRQQMAPLEHEWAGAIEDDATRRLVRLLVVSDRELGDLCRQLSQHIDRLEQPTEQRAGRTTPWT
jgi:hypothetical protein